MGSKDRSKGRHKTRKRPGQTAGQPAAVTRNIQAGNQRVQSVRAGKKGHGSAQASLKKQMAGRLVGKTAGRSVSAAKSSAKKYARKEASKAKDLIRKLPESASQDMSDQSGSGFGQDTLMDTKQSLQTGQKVLHKTEGSLHKVYRTGSDSVAAYRALKEHGTKKKDTKAQNRSNIQSGTPSVQMQAGQATSPVRPESTVKKKALKKRTGSGRKNASVKALSKTSAAKKKGKKAAGNIAAMSVHATAKTAATTVAAAGKAGSVAAHTVAAVPVTAAKAAATAATGGTAGVGFVISAMAKKVLNVFKDKRNPLRQIFRMPKADGMVEELIRTGVRKMLLSIVMPIAALAILCGGFLFLFTGFVGSVSTSPIRFVLFTGEELEEMAPLIEFMDQEEDDFGFSTSVYENAYNSYIQTINAQLSEYREDGYQVIYDGYEGTSSPDNYSAVYACMVGLGSAEYTLADVLLGEESAIAAFEDLLLEMCTIAVDTESEQAIVTLMSCEDYITASGCSSQEAAEIRAVYNGLTAGSGSSVQELPEDTQEYLQEIASQDGIPGTVITFALSVQGTPYSQSQRDSGSYYDCSSFVYYCYKAAGIPMVHGGANTAAAEAQYCQKYGQIIDVEDLQPGDLLFYSYLTNGRYKNISHVEMYLGNGLVIDCTETPGVSVRQFTTDRLVLCGRPY